MPEKQLKQAQNKFSLQTANTNVLSHCLSSTLGDSGQLIAYMYRKYSVLATLHDPLKGILV